VQTADENSKDLDQLRAQITFIEDDDRKAADAIDKIVMVGGPAAILASLTFMKDVAPSPAAGTLTILMASWVLLLAGALSATLSLLTTRSTARAYARMLKGKVKARTSTIAPADYDKIRPWNTATRWLNRGGIAALLSGVVFLVWFAQANLPRERLGDVTGTKGDSTAVASARAMQSVLSECVRTRCAIVFGYDYDVPGRPKVSTSSAAKARAGARP
jgi:hypothetical protein